MGFSSSLRHLSRQQSEAFGTVPVASRRRATFRPRLEPLESREVLSTLTVINALDSGPGSLRAEIAAAHGGDTIVFSNIPKGQTIALTSGELLIDKGLTIQGPGAGQLAISGGGSSRVFEVAAGVQATLAGLTLKGGDGHAAVVAYTAYDGDGGAILNRGTLTVSSSTVSGSSAEETGGGIFSAGTLTVSSSTISGNIAYRAGGIYSNGTATLTGCTLSGNTASGGSPGGFGWSNSMAWMYGAGGGIYNDGTMTVSGSTISGNVVASGQAGGGGIYNSRTLTVSSSTISGNTAADAGGGIYNDEGATLTLKQSTVTQNTAYWGADLYNLGYVTSKGSQIG